MVEVLGDTIVNIRIAEDRNGPFRCWLMAPGSQRTMTSPITDAQTVLTVRIVESHIVEYIQESSLDDDFLTGEGTIAIEAKHGEGDVVLWSETVEASGFVDGTWFSMSGSREGALQRIGEVGALPEPEGMNGVWILSDSDGPVAAIQIRELRVIEFAHVFASTNLEDADIIDSDPVTSTSTVGRTILIALHRCITG